MQRWGCDVPLAGGLSGAGSGGARQRAAPGAAGRAHGRLPRPDLYGDLCAGSSTLVVLVTAERDTALRRQAAERGWGFLLKPVRPSALRAR